MRRNCCAVAGLKKEGTQGKEGDSPLTASKEGEPQPYTHKKLNSTNQEWIWMQTCFQILQKRTHPSNHFDFSLVTQHRHAVVGFWPPHNCTLTTGLLYGTFIEVISSTVCKTYTPTEECYSMWCAARSFRVMSLFQAQRTKSCTSSPRELDHCAFAQATPPDKSVLFICSV